MLIGSAFTEGSGIGVSDNSSFFHCNKIRVVLQSCFNAGTEFTDLRYIIFKCDRSIQHIRCINCQDLFCVINRCQSDYHVYTSFCADMIFSRISTALATIFGQNSVNR